MKLKIKRVHTSGGMARYSVGFDSGIPQEFLIQVCPTSGRRKEWNTLFARSVAVALERWCKVNGEPQ